MYGGNFGYWTEILMEVSFTVYVQILRVIYRFISGGKFYLIIRIFVVCSATFSKSQVIPRRNSIQCFRLIYVMRRLINLAQH